MAGFYLTNNLPTPLESNEEMILIGKNDDESKKALVERNLRLVWSIADKFKNNPRFKSNCYDFDDLMSIGSIGLIRAVNTFDRRKKIKLSTYACKCITYEITNYLRNLKLRQETSLNALIADSNNPLRIRDVLFDEFFDIFKNIEIAENKKILTDAIEKVLNENEKKVIQLRYNFSNNKKMLTQREVADIMGCTNKNISRIEKEAINKLKVFFNRYFD